MMAGGSESLVPWNSASICPPEQKAAKGFPMPVAQAWAWDVN